MSMTIESLHEKIKRVKEKCADDPYLLSFFEDLEREIDKDRGDTKDMIDKLFRNRIPRDSSMYINF